MHAKRSFWGVSFFGLISCTGLMWGKVEILGEISIDLKTPAAKQAKGEEKPVERTRQVTKAAPVECIYQYPETKQVEAMLSNMMNQLTKMFVRMDHYLRSDSRREEHKENKRFKIVKEKRSEFFDDIYMNMTEEYRRFANHTQQRIMRATDPCEHQREIRDVWRALLDSSQESVRRAALACVEKYLLVTRASGEGGERGGIGRARSRASQLLRREIARVRSDQLALLCDNFQLCYNDLI